jgi:hypothetical protein
MSFVRRIVVAGAFGAAGASLALSSGAAAAPLVAVVVEGSTVTVSTSDCASSGAVAAIQPGSNDATEQDMAGNPEASGVLSATFSNVQPGTYTATVNCKDTTSPDPGTKQFTVTPDGNPDTGDGATARLGRGTTALAAAGLGVLGVTLAGGVVLLVRRRPNGD